MIKGLSQWLSYLENSQLPVLKETLRRILQITESDRATVSRLAETIMKDPDLAASVLKLANSAMYNPTRTTVNTVSRAIMVIGFNSVKSMAITSLLVDQLKKTSKRTQLFRCLTKSVHAAVQARFLARQCQPQSEEEVFVAALLVNIGEAAFWSVDNKEIDLLSDEYEGKGYLDAPTQRDILGTTFRALSQALVSRWQLGSLLEESLGEHIFSKEAQIVKAATSIAHIHLENKTESGPASLRLMQPLLQRPEPVIKRVIAENTKAAIALAEALGIPHAKKYLNSEPVREISVQETDPLLQLNYLQQITAMPNGKISDEMIEAVMAGLHLGVGFERVGIFLSKELDFLHPAVDKTPPGASARGSHQFQLYKFIGKGTDKWFSGRTCKVRFGLPMGKVFRFDEKARILETDEALPKAELQFHAPFVSTKIPSLGVLCGLRNRYTVLVYADRCNLARIDQDRIRSFQLFAQQLMYKMADRKPVLSIESCEI
ncbi:MAG: HDOD domain-containing protein [Pseudomonadales bacterium]|nr:HDOD domain-containing protein [Pseudomonadales bacterium]